MYNSCTKYISAKTDMHQDQSLPPIPLVLCALNIITSGMWHLPMLQGNNDL